MVFTTVNCSTYYGMYYFGGLKKHSEEGLILEPTLGLEPRTYGLRYRCSAIELGRRMFILNNKIGGASLPRPVLGGAGLSWQ